MSEYNKGPTTKYEKSPFYIAPPFAFGMDIG
jgi:hypothetical protein